MLLAHDPEGGAVTYKLLVEPTTGTFKLNDVTLAANDTFTAADVAAGRVVFQDDTGIGGTNTVQLAALDPQGNYCLYPDRPCEPGQLCAGTERF